MDIAEDRHAPRVRERSAKPARAPWTYRCRLAGRNLVVDVDAFSASEAAALAAGHWGVEIEAVAVDGQRRRWMRWIGISTHDAGRSGMALDRDWWYTAKLVAVIVVSAAAAFVVNATLL